MGRKAHRWGHRQRRRRRRKGESYRIDVDRRACTRGARFGVCTGTDTAVDRSAVVKVVKRACAGRPGGGRRSCRTGRQGRQSRWDRGRRRKAGAERQPGIRRHVRDYVCLGVDVCVKVVSRCLRQGSVKVEE